MRPTTPSSSSPATSCRRGEGAGRGRPTAALKANAAIKARERPQEPEHRAPRRVELKDPRAGNASIRRFYLAPSYAKADKGEAEALYVLMKIAGNGATSRLYQKLVVRGEGGVQRRRLVLGQRPRQRLDRRLRRRPPRASASTRSSRRSMRVLHELREKPVTDDELERAKKAFIAEFIYELDSQSSLARRYGEGLVARPDDRRDQQLAGGGRQGDRRRRASGWPTSIWTSAAR